MQLERVLRQAEHLSFSADPRALAECNVFIATVPTPIDEHKRPDLTPLIKASETIGKVLKRELQPAMEAAAKARKSARV